MSARVDVKRAFEDCYNLEEIEIPQGVRVIGACAFFDCSSLKEVRLPEGITGIEHRAFFRCSSLRKIEIPESVTLMERKVFEGCGNLKIILRMKETNLVKDFAAILDGEIMEIRSYTIPITKFPDEHTKGCVLFGTGQMILSDKKHLPICLSVSLTRCDMVKQVLSEYVRNR